MWTCITRHVLIVYERERVKSVFSQIPSCGFFKNSISNLFVSILKKTCNSGNYSNRNRCIKIFRDQKSNLILAKINAIFKMPLLCSSKSIFYDLGLKKFLRAYISTIRTAFFENCVNFGQNLFKKDYYNCLNASFLYSIETKRFEIEFFKNLQLGIFEKTGFKPSKRSFLGGFLCEESIVRIPEAWKH